MRGSIFRGTIIAFWRRRLTPSSRRPLPTERPQERHMRRHAIPADLDRVFDIHMHKAAMPFLGSDPMPREAFGRVFDPLLDSGCFCVFEVEGRVQGFYTGATVSWSRRACRPSGDAGGGTGSTRQRHCRRDDGRRPHPSAQSRRHPGELTVEADNPRASPSMNASGSPMREPSERPANAPATKPMLMG